MKRSDLLIVGTGAMACLFAARFSMAGIPVMMLGSWPAGVKALSQNGVKLVEPDGCEFNTPVSISADPLDCTGMRLGLILVKSWQTERAAQQLSTCLGQDGLVLTLQNGVGNREILVQHLGSQRVAVGSTTSGATLLAPGVVRAAGEGVITLGIHAQLAPLSDLLGKAGFVVETVSDIQSIQWGKLVINAAINPLTAILGVRNGELLKRPSSRSLLSLLAREAAAVAVAKGVHLPFPDPVIAAESIARRTADNLSSMLQDVRRGAPTEIDVICGAVVKAGEQTGVSTPYNRSLWLLVKAIVG